MFVSAMINYARILNSFSEFKTPKVTLFTVIYGQVKLFETSKSWKISRKLIFKIWKFKKTGKFPENSEKFWDRGIISKKKIPADVDSIDNIPFGFKIYKAKIQLRSKQCEYIL